MIRPRDAAGHFINRQTWELAYRLAGERVPSRVGVRNASAPLTRQQVEAAARRHRTVAPAKPAKRARRKAKPTVARTVQRERTAFPSGSEFELTARYRGNARGEPRQLHIKIRVGLTSPMTAAQARTLLDVAMQSGRVPPGINIFALDWQHGEGERGKAGSYIDPGHRVLRDFYGAIGGEHRAGTRFAPVEPDYTDEDEGDDDD